MNKTPKAKEKSLYKKLLDFYIQRECILSDKGYSFIETDKTLVYDRSILNINKKPNPIMIIGEAPGENEVKEEKPFVGLAGKNLDNLISFTTLNRQIDFLVTNAFPFRTFRNGLTKKINRTPTNYELKLGSSLLLKEIEIIRPKMILILGGSAKKSIKKINDSSFSEILKNIQNHTFKELSFSSIEHKTILGITFHPSPLVYNQSIKKAELIDFFKKLELQL